MCGGTLLIVTCSHVGHVFRKATPYTFPGGTGRIINHNNARLANVWMDDWQHFFYRISPGSFASQSVGSRPAKCSPDVFDIACTPLSVTVSILCALARL